MHRSRFGEPSCIFSDNSIRIHFKSYASAFTYVSLWTAL